MITVAPSFDILMQLGHTALQHHGFERARNYFLNAEAGSVTHIKLAESRQMQGVCERLLGRLNAAQKTLELALESARKQSSQRLLAAILRDLGEVYHEQALRTDSQSQRTALFKKADAYFDESIILADSAGFIVESAASLSFKGVSWFEQGNKREGQRILRESFHFLWHHTDNRVYETNALIRLMRCSFVDRWMYLPHALRLTGKDSASHADRNKVYAALLGNKLFRIIKARHQRK